MTTQNLKLPLFLTRLFITYFLLMWALDRFMAAEHAATVAKKFYTIGPLSLSAIPLPVIGGLWLVLIAAFFFGFKKKISYGLVLILHILGTVFTLPYLIPGTEKFTLIFLASLPTIGAMLLLYLLRDEDTMLSLNR